MTALLNKAFDEASKLPQERQDALAKLILEEMVSDDQWQQAFDQSADVLADLAQRARESYRRGETQPLDPDQL